MEFVAADVEALHRGFGDLDAFLVGSRVEGALYFEAGFGRRRGNQLDYGGAIGERSGAPVLGDVTEQAMLDLVPFRGSRRIVANLEREPGVVGELLQLQFPQPRARRVRAFAVGRDRQLTSVRIALPPHL